MQIIITGKAFTEKRMVFRKTTIYPTNFGNLTVHGIAQIEGIKPQSVINKIGRGLYSENKKKVGRPLGAKKIKEEVVLENKTKLPTLGSWEQEQLMQETK